MTKPNKNKARIAVLERELRETQAQLAHVYHFAKIALPGLAPGNMRGSAVIVQLHYLGGKEVCPAFALKDGMSAATVAALTDDIRYSYDKTVEFKP